MFSSTILSSFIFAFNYLSFLNYHKDLLQEENLNVLIKKYKIQYLANHETVNQICLMPSLNIKIKTCPIRYFRYSNIEKLNKDIYVDIKSNGGSIAFINYDITKKIKFDLKDNEFKKLLTIKNVKYLFNKSPLYLAKQVPNFLIIEIYQ